MMACFYLQRFDFASGFQSARHASLWANSMVALASSKLVSPDSAVTQRRSTSSPGCLKSSEPHREELVARLALQPARPALHEPSQRVERQRRAGHDVLVDAQAALEQCAQAF